jgi:acylphosphatase
MVAQPERPEAAQPAEWRGYRVFGRVQGVGFRQWTRRTAEHLGLSGTVRNLPDGSVEVMARGGAGALTRLEAGLERGPLAARVQRVERLDTVTDGRAEGFRIVS